MQKLDSEAVKRNQQLVVDAVNHLAKLTCTACGHGLGASLKIWECQDETHRATNGYINATARSLGATRCAKCGVISIRPYDEMVEEPGHLVYGEGGPVKMCNSCWRLSYD